MPNACRCLALGLALFSWAAPAWAKTEKPTAVAEEFFRLASSGAYDDIADLLSSADLTAVRQLKTQMGARGKNVDVGKMIAESFSLIQGAASQAGPAGMPKKKDAETIMPQKISFYVPGQYYVVGNFAAVLTRETYEIAHADTGPVRDDPRKLWVDPTNVLSKVRDEAYFKQWWIWEGDRLTMPGLLWMIKENNTWKVDLWAGTVPRRVFDKDLFLHFGRNVFEPEANRAKAKTKPPTKPKNATPAAVSGDTGAAPLRGETKH